MGEREETGIGEGCAGCLMAVIAMAVGLVVWQDGARPGVLGAFEGERDWSLLYVELPLMLFGFPVVAMVVWGLTGRVLRGRAGRWVRGGASAVAAAVSVAVLAWVSLAWLEVRVAPFVNPGW
ncbi:hypothetical protein [Streptomyces sp. HNM0574]|uniref:hypothetical protein n=1 Tax=Streptomyces sp. HNM0574 TaxID=2714954 RepID=UPI00146E42D3|nr:hypothetical protein [Streptomyces sp. HNM0574]NLU66166.1 hypothetical protein [Streptomyces sp. HNM0574]